MKQITIKKIVLTLSSVFVVGTIYAQNSDVTLKFWETESFAIRLTVALISSLVSFIVAYFFYRRNKSKEPLKQISYELEKSNGLVEIDEKIRGNINISYMGTPIDNLSYIKTTFENTGNRIIKNQHVRFQLESKSTFIESFFNPVPEKELSAVDTYNGEDNEKTIKIGHLEKGQKVSYHLVVSGENPQIKLHPFNEEGGIEFATRSATKEVTDKQILKRFFLIIIILVIIPEVFGLIEMGGIHLPSLVRTLLFLVLIKDIMNGIRILVEKIFEEDNKQTSHSHANIEGNENIVIQTVDGASIDIGKKPNKRQKSS